MHLVGAGPGDPELITLRGMKLLARADVVVYDYLANEKLLAHCPQAQCIYVGKKGAQHTMSQDSINQLLIEQGQAGLRVVRLKGGDPFVFGRGAEEAEALEQAGIAFEIVPGITAAIGGLAYAGIPITHRDFNSSFTLVTGHEKQEDSSDLNWSALAKLPCVAFYMGIGSLRHIAEQLIAHGMDSNLPAATVQWGSTPRQRTAIGTLSSIFQQVQEAGIGSPAITVIGKVVSLRPILNWFERRPLFGQKIVVTRTRQQASELSEKLLELGAEVIEAPTIQLVEPTDWTEIDRALDEAKKYDWIVFTSVNGVAAVKNRLLKTDRDARVFGSAEIAAIGTATAEAIESQFCLRVRLCPERFVAEALGDQLLAAGEVKDKRFLLLRAEIAREVLVKQLTAGGAREVRDVGIYRTEPAAQLPAELPKMIAAGQIQWITFTSSSTARNFLALLGPDSEPLMKKVRSASIGPVTTRTLGELKVQVDAEAQQANVTSLVMAILQATAK